MRTTLICGKEDTFRAEKPITLKEWFQLGRRMKPGMLFILANDFESKAMGEYSTEYERIYIGNALVQTGPIESQSLCHEWDFEHERMNKRISEVHYPFERVDN